MHAAALAMRESEHGRSGSANELMRDQAKGDGAQSAPDQTYYMCPKESLERKIVPERSFRGIPVSRSWS